MKSQSRRSFLKNNVSSAALLLGAGASGGLGLSLGIPASARGQDATPALPKEKVKLGIATYSYWHFKGPRVTVETVVEKAGQLGVTAVDILHRQMDSEEPAYLRKLKRTALAHGVTYNCLSIHQNFVMPYHPDRQKEIDHTIRCMQIAHELGIHCLRINSGRWNTVSFDKLMELRGDEPPIAGFTEDDAFSWCIECLEKCLPKAEQYGITLAVENHWGLTRSPEGLLRISNAIKSPWCGILMDTGNFLENPYEKLQQIASRTVYVQAKTYFGGGEWYTLDLDYSRIAKMLYDVGYKGYVSLEFEGKENPDIAVPKSIAALKKGFGIS